VYITIWVAAQYLHPHAQPAVTAERGNGPAKVLQGSTVSIQKTLFGGAGGGGGWGSTTSVQNQNPTSPIISPLHIFGGVHGQVFQSLTLGGSVGHAHSGQVPSSPGGGGVSGGATPLGANNGRGLGLLDGKALAPASGPSYSASVVQQNHRPPARAGAGVGSGGATQPGAIVQYMGGGMGGGAAVGGLGAQSASLIAGKGGGGGGNGGVQNAHQAVSGRGAPAPSLFPQVPLLHISIYMNVCVCVCVCVSVCVCVCMHICCRCFSLFTPRNSD
jgi:hypothetical protein